MSDSTDVTMIEDPVIEEPPDDAVKRRLGLGFWVAVTWIVVVVSAALLAPYLPLIDPTDTLYHQPREGPSFSALFGSDALGQDLFSRVLYGTRVSLFVGFAAILFGLLVGGTLGIVAGYFRGWIDQIISFLMFVLLSFPALVLAILISASVETRTIWTVGLTIGVLAIAPVGRLARATTLVYAEREFVAAARVIGARHHRIIIKELLPNVVIPMGALALLGIAIAIVAEGALAYLGLSVEGTDEGAISLGRVLFDATNSSRELQDAPHVAFITIGVLFLTVASLNFAGDRIREYFDVRETAF